MTRAGAEALAERLARKNRRDYHVVWSVEDEDALGQSWHVATDWDLDTFYQGIADCNIVTTHCPSDYYPAVRS